LSLLHSNRWPLENRVSQGRLNSSMLGPAGEG